MNYRRLFRACNLSTVDAAMVLTLLVTSSSALAQCPVSPQDPVRKSNPPPIAEEYYKKAGILHKRGDWDGVMFWNKKAAELGHEYAQNDLAFGYANGRGSTKQDYKKALYWWCKAAEQGDEYAEHALAVMYSYGLAGLPQDYNRVADWLNRSAQHGNVQAMYEFGRLLSKPIVLPAPDKNGALYWLGEAAKRGNKEAAQLRNDLTRQWAAEHPGTDQSHATPLELAEDSCSTFRCFSKQFAGQAICAAHRSCVNNWLRAHGYQVAYPW